MDDFHIHVDDLLDDIHRIIDEVPVKDPEMDPLPEFSLLADEHCRDNILSDAEAGSPAPPAATRRAAQQYPSSGTSAYWTQTQKLPRYVAKHQKNQEQAYADWLYAQESHEATPPAPQQTSGRKSKRLPQKDPVPVKKKAHGFRNFVIIVLLLALLLLAAVLFLLPKQPAAAGSPEVRSRDVCTILLAGTDQLSNRTDTLMLLTADRINKTLSLVSIPRDTLVYGNYSIPKINGVYAVNGGGSDGIEMLMTRVSQCIGFRPDGYVILHLDMFQDFVDLMGGVSFTVPTDMYYNDPSQDLVIDLSGGTQTLDGQSAMGLVRFRSGYADADLGRISMQQQFLSALIGQLVSPRVILRSPQLLELVLEHTDTNLSAANCLWLAETVLLSDRSNIQTVTLPGTAKYIDGGSYYVLDPAAVAQTVSTYCNPFETPITQEHLEIRQN